MTNNACFRVSVDEVAKDFAKYAELAKTRTFEIYDRGQVEVMLVRIDAVPNFHDQLQTNIPAGLMSDAERVEFSAQSQRLRRWIEENGDVWPDEVD
ncbi:hypothetical protein [Qipengyuania qiaonensis]|uniref:DUF3467 domain-containing protein n=1 Tax=Qipengyuania qiaonensis TaxID=2867240 RepID=A0ABS7J918_9SPHN|nr:hypothetical protein [Qipengyuania qiaonensis]MBX7483818.1 hypothetical protein [Qipengyuania qiaonensis]